MQISSGGSRDWTIPPIGMVIKILKDQDLGNLGHHIRSGDWLVFPNVSNNYFREVIKSESVYRRVRVRIAINLAKLGAMAQKERASGFDHYGFPVEDTAGEGKKSSLYLYYEYTIWEAVGSLNVNLDIYTMYDKPLKLLKGYDLIIPGYADFYVCGEERGGFSFVDKLLADAGYREQ